MRIGEELGYNKFKEKVLFDLMRQKLNEEQLATFNAIVAVVESHEQDPQQQQPSDAFFVYGSAGTGKTSDYNYLCSHFCTPGKIVISVATSRIAAQLLPGGRIVHSMFNIHLSTDFNAVSNITNNSYFADLILRTSLLNCDEVPMQ